MQAVEVAKTAAKSITDVENIVEDSESSKDEEEVDESAAEDKNDDEIDKRSKSALDKLEKASEDSFLGQASHKLEKFGSNFLYVYGSAT